MTELGYVFLVGMILGFGISIPVGPINILCVQRTLNDGRRAGLICGLGAATADAIYGLIAAIGLSLVAEYIVEHTVLLRVAGGIALILLGGKTLYDGMKARTIDKTDDSRRHWFREWASHAGNYAATFLLTLTNPATILAFAAMFAALGIARRDLNHFTETGLFLGVFCGSTLWWCTVVLIVAWFRNRIRPERLLTVNKIAGALMALIGLFILVSPLFWSQEELEDLETSHAIVHHIIVDGG